jgi:hypothetical protein
MSLGRVTAAIVKLSVILALAPFIGPAIALAQDAPATVAWKPIGPGGGGALQAAAVSPGDPNVVLEGSDVGGIFRTTDGGQTWLPRNDHLVNPENGAFVYSTVVDPAFSLSDPNVVAVLAHRSTDGGATFTFGTDVGVQSVAIDPFNKNLRYLAEVVLDVPCPGCVRIKKFDDSTGTPTAGTPFGPCSVGPPVKPMYVNSLLVDYTDATQIWAATNCGLYRSTNSGQTFSYWASSGLPHNGVNGINKIAQGNQLSGYVLILVAGGSFTQFAGNGVWDGGVFWSNDHGFTFYNASGTVSAPVTPNSDFEADTDGDPTTVVDGWVKGSVFGGFSPGASASQVCGDSYSGSCSVRLISPASGTNAYTAIRTNFIPVTPGTRYNVNLATKITAQTGAGLGLLTRVFWYKTANFGDPATIPTPQGGTWINTFSKNLADVPNWTPLEHYTTAPPQANYAVIEAQVISLGTTVYLDGYSFSPSTALPRAANYTELATDGLGNMYVAPADIDLSSESGQDESLWSVYKSTDLGQNWYRMTRRWLTTPWGAGPNMTLLRTVERGRWVGMNAMSLAMGTSTPTYPNGNQVVYFATGLWLYKSADGGATWTETGTTKIGVDPNDFYVGALNGIGVQTITLDIRKRNRLYYGDEDNLMQVANDLDDPNTTAATPTFQTRGPQTVIQGGAPIVGDAATSILTDPTDPNHLFVGIASSNMLKGSGTTGVAEAFLDASGTIWNDWFHLSPIGNGPGGIDLAIDTASPRNLYASKFSAGIYRRVADFPHDTTPSAWTRLDPGVNGVTFTPTPNDWYTFKIRKSPTSGRLYAGFGHPQGNCVGGLAACPPPNVPSGDTGVWMTNTSAPPTGSNGNTWVKITGTGALNDPLCFNSNTVANMQNEPVETLLAVGSNTLYVGTHGVLQPGKGGLYRGVCSGACAAASDWAWCKVLPTAAQLAANPGLPANVTGIVQSAESSTVFYAMVSQNKTVGSYPAGKAGLWTSRDFGLTWQYVPNDPTAPIQNLWEATLAAWPDDPTPGVIDEPRTLYAGTFGTGMFQGKVTCNQPGPGNPDTDGDGIADYCDNCKNVANADQKDSDQNGIGNMCQTVTPPPFESIASEDGRIEETGENTNVGMTPVNDSTSGALRIGDTSNRHQYRSIVSFDTSSLPDNAIITSATLALVRGSASGNAYTGSFGTAWVDIGSPIGTNTLQSTDWQQSSGVVTQVGSLSQAQSNGATSTATLNAAGMTAISKTAPHTQFRIRFNGDDDNDGTADYIGYYSGETAGNRPKLMLQYVTP